MNNLLLIILSLSITGSILAAILFLTKPIYKNKLSKKWQYYIWVIVLMGFMIPFPRDLNPTFQILSQINPEVNPITQVIQENLPQLLPGINSSEANANSISEIIISNLWWFWLAIALILFVRKITIYQSFRKYNQAGQIEVTDIKILEQFGAILEKHRVKNNVNLATNSLLASPLLLGFRKPSIILPTLDLSEQDFYYTILHELTHMKRMDMLYKWWVQLVVCLQWFNPIVYLLERETNKLCELACDEAVIAKIDAHAQKAYGETLLNAIKNGGNYQNSLATTNLNQSKKSLKERLEAIMSYKKQSRLMIFISGLLTVVFCVTALSISAYATPQPATQTPWKNMQDDTGSGYIYTQNGFYEYPYIFELGWNLNEKGENAYKDKAKVTLSNNKVMNVSFDKSCRNYIKETKTLASLTKLLNKLTVKHELSSHPIKSPLVVSVEYVGDKDLNTLASDYYHNESLAYFGAIFPTLDKDTQKQYCLKTFKDKRVAFFATMLPSLNTDLINTCAIKAYQEKNIAFFACIAPYLSPQAKEAWIKQATKDKRTNFLAVLDGI